MLICMLLKKKFQWDIYFFLSTNSFYATEATFQNKIELKIVLQFGQTSLWGVHHGFMPPTLIPVYFWSIKPNLMI